MAILNKLKSSKELTINIIDFFAALVYKSGNRPAAGGTIRFYHKKAAAVKYLQS